MSQPFAEKPVTRASKCKRCSRKMLVIRGVGRPREFCSDECRSRNKNTGRSGVKMLDLQDEYAQVRCHLGEALEALEAAEFGYGHRDAIAVLRKHGRTL